jgi:hypothetical protein
MNEIINPILMLLSVLLFFGGMIAVILVSFDFGIIPMVMGLIDLIVAKAIFPVAKEKGVVKE